MKNRDIEAQIEILSGKVGFPYTPFHRKLKTGDNIMWLDKKKYLMFGTIRIIKYKPRQEKALFYVEGNGSGYFLGRVIDPEQKELVIALLNRFKLKKFTRDGSIWEDSNYCIRNLGII